MASGKDVERLNARGYGVLQTALASVLWGTVFVAAGFLLQYVGQSLTNAPDATLLANLAPVLVPLVGWILVKESISKIQATAGAFGLSGLLFIATPNLRFQVSSLPGDLLLLGASLSFALFIVLSKRVKAVSAGSALAVIVAVTVFLTPAALTLGRLNPFNFTLGMAGWSSALYMGAMCTVIPMVFYLRGLRSISASESGTLLLLEVLSGLILAVFVLGQVPTQYEIAAGAAIISALAMSIIFKQKSA
jgi:drug/metabolite transporter (DMT)-like permease